MPVKANDHNKSGVKKVSMPTLIYPGCGYDEELLSLQLPYDRIIAYDTLPRYHHYIPGQPGWTHTATPDLFFAKLRHEYGQFVEVSDTELHFPRHNITYHNSTNCCHVEVPRGRHLRAGLLLRVLDTGNAAAKGACQLRYLHRRPV